MADSVATKTMTSSKMNHNIYATADEVARFFVEEQIDPNEVAKAFVYLRRCLQRGDISAWWKWLDLVSGNGARAIIRSKQTRDYYQSINRICKSHLQRLTPDEIIMALGWSIRLMRYYGTAGALKQPSPFREEYSAKTPAQPAPQASSVPPTSIIPPKVPAVGEIFTGEITTIDTDEEIAAIDVPGFSAKEVLGLMKMGHPNYQVKQRVRVAVTKTDEIKGRIILWVEHQRTESKKKKKK